MTLYGTDLGLQLPSTWRRRCDPVRGVLVAARPDRLPTSGRSPELTLRCAIADGTLATWRAEAMVELSEKLADFALEDVDDFDLFGHDVVYRRFAYRENVHDILCDQWAWLHQGLGITLTCSVAREDYPDFCDLFEVVAESVDLDRRVA